MIFTPKVSKFKKSQKGRVLNKVSNNNSFHRLRGSLGLKAITTGRLDSKQLVSMKQTINKFIKKSGRVIVNVFPHQPISKKPKEIRMGKGKGGVDHWVSKIVAGSILCEIETNSTSNGLTALKAAQIRLPIRTKIVFH